MSKPVFVISGKMKNIKEAILWLKNEVGGNATIGKVIDFLQGSPQKYQKFLEIAKGL